MRKLLLTALLLLPLPASATLPEPGLLEVKVRVPDQSREVQEGAFASGLKRVLVRLSGDSKVLEKLETPPPRRYVKQFRYGSTDEPEDGSVVLPGAEPMLELWIQYDEDRLTSLLRNSGIPVWFSERDPAVIWLAVRDGMQHYLLRDSDDSRIRSAVDTVAADRGIALHWPRYDATDQARLRFADVWGGFEQPLRKASARYSAGPVIAANMVWTEDGWVGEWYLYDGSLRRHWMLQNQDYASLLAAGMNHVVDVLGSRYAVLDEGISNASQLRITFRGVDDTRAYRKVERILQQHPAVKESRLHSIADDAALFDVYLRTDEQDFLDRMRRNRDLRQLAVEREPASIEEMQQQSSGRTAADRQTAVPHHSWRLLAPVSLN